MTTKIICIPNYEPKFNTLDNIYEDKSLYELKNTYNNGCICPCFEHKRILKKQEQKVNNGLFNYNELNKLKAHMKTIQHKNWLEHYNKINYNKDINEKSHEELKSAYLQLDKDNRKKIVDIKLAYDDKINEIKNELENKYKKIINEKEETINILTLKIKEFQKNQEIQKKQEIEEYSNKKVINLIDL